MEILRYTCAILAVVFGYCAAWKITGISIGTALERIFGGFVDTTVKVVNDQSKKSQKKLDRVNKAKRKKSLAYYYRNLVNDILLDIGWKHMGVTVEGLTILALIVTIMINLIGLIVLKSVFMFILGIAVTYCLIIAILFTTSRSRHRLRKSVLIATEDLLCSSMGNGLIKAVKDNINQMDNEVKPDFQKFLDDIDNRMEIELAIDRLNDRLGSKFDNFCEKAKVMSTNYRQGYEDAFLFNIADNAVESRLDAEIADTFESLNMDYFATLGLLVVFFLIMNGVMGNMTEWYLGTFAGKLVLFLYVAFAAGVFVYTQIVQSKRF